MRFLWVLLAAAPLLGQPLIYRKAVVNAASLAPPDLPHGGLARGSLFLIVGRGLGPAEPARAAGVPTDELGGVSVRVFQGETSVKALPVYVSESRIFALLPNNAPLGRASVAVSFRNVSSSGTPVRIVQRSIGLFGEGAVDVAGSEPALAVMGLGFGPASIRTIPESTRVIILRATGLASIAYDRESQTESPLEVWVGGTAAAVQWIRRSSLPGVDEIAVEIPENAPGGCYVPVQARLRADVSSNVVTVPVAAPETACSDSFNPLAEQTSKPGKSGAVFLFRSSAPVLSFQLSADTAAGFFRESAKPSYHPFTSLPPSGSCTAHSGVSWQQDQANLPGLSTLGKPLASGLTPTASVGDPFLWLVTAFKLSASRLGPEATPPESRTVAGAATADVGPILATLTPPPALTWKDPSTGDVLRSRDLPVSWNPVEDSSALVLISGFSYHQPTNTGTTFLCVAGAADGARIIPSYVLANLPASSGYLAIGLLRPADATALTIEGLDAAVAAPIAVSAREVNIR